MMVTWGLVKSFSKIKHQQGNKNSMYGKCWIYNNSLKLSKRIDKDEVLPLGWEYGRKIKF